MMNNYDDIINLPYQKSLTHKHMSNSDRAAQFAPFAALTGYDALIKETARSVSKKIILTNEKAEEISNKINYILTLKNNDVPIIITYFKKDKKKEGGTYLKITIKSLNVDLYQKCIKTEDLTIKINDIIEIESDLFDDFF